jgi:hypothetical protein
MLLGPTSLLARRGYEFEANLMVTSAKELAESITHSHGVLPNQITAEHLDDFYSKLHRVYTRISEQRMQSILQTTTPIPRIRNAPFVAVIVDTRKHRALERVVMGLQNTLKIPVQLFHGQSNRQYILNTSIANAVERGEVVLTQLNTEELKIYEYNQLLLTNEFWNSLIGNQKVLVFQADSFACPSSRYTLKDFAHFDYIGSCWRANRPSGLNIEGGNGGFSLRDWRMTLKAIEQFPPELWPAGEDGYFAFHMELMGGRVASFEESTKFGSQCAFRASSLGAHRVVSMPVADRRKFLNYCPEAIDVFPCLAEFKDSLS